MEVCDSAFLGTSGFLYGTIVPLSALAAFLTITILVIVYFFASFLQNPKLNVWVKTEIVQVFISLSALIIMIGAINSFCSLDANSIRDLMGKQHSPSGTIFDEAENYLVRSANFAHGAINVTRHFLSAYTIFIYRNTFDCDLWGLGCLFGGSGISFSSLAKYNGKFGALNMLFGTTILYFLTAANMLFIFLFVKKGLVLFFLPLAVIVRSLPYMRSLGAVLIAVCISFFMVYPLALSVFSLMSDDLLDTSKLSNQINTILNNKPSNYFYSVSGGSEFLYGSVLGAFGTSRYTDDTTLKEDFFPEDGNDDFNGLLEYISKTFVVSFLLPSLALAATIASVRYFARLYGEDVDLSRISQLV